MVLRWIKSFLAQDNSKEHKAAELSGHGGSVSIQGGLGAMWLLVGLGNPGAKYKKNRHNVGFMVIESIADAASLSSKFRSKFQAEMAEGVVFGKKAILLKPQTYMNNSGQSVAAAAQFYKIAPENIIVFHDEIDLEPNTIRAKKGGGNAGHNGLKSIQAHLGTAEYWRVRIGIGRSLHGADVSDYVLDDFSKDEQIWLEPLLSDISKELKVFFDTDSKVYEKKLNELIQRRRSL